MLVGAVVSNVSVGVHDVRRVLAAPRIFSTATVASCKLLMFEASIVSTLLTFVV
jgi:hypothetical protein